MTNAVLPIEWTWATFAELSAAELYELLALRQRVFVVEQQCIYLDADGHDPLCVHGFGRRDGVLVACVRLVPPGLTYSDASIGRVAIDEPARGGGLGHDLVRGSLDECAARFPGEAITIGAQLYLQAFYEGHGFSVVGDPYDEDGIMHVDMRRPAAASGPGPASGPAA